MADAAHMTRRAAVVGAGATITGLASVNSVVASVAKTGAKTVDAQLVELADKFKEAAKIIDPTIKGAWFGHSADDNKLFWVQLERDRDPFGAILRTALSSEIERLYREWLVVRELPAVDGEEVETDSYRRYAALQQQITSIRPRTVKELAIQWMVETDMGESCARDEFFEAVKALAT